MKKQVFKKLLMLILASVMTLSAFVSCAPAVDPAESTPEETPVESPSDTEIPESSEPAQSETEPSSSETEPESETNKNGIIELPRDEF